MNLLVKNDLFDYKNRYIMQFENAFKFSLDSLLLAEFVSVKKTDKNILDMCTGNAPVPLILSLKTNSFITGFEIQKDIAYLASESVKINNIENIKIINDDIKNIDKYFNKNYFDIITCNPPYFNTLDNGYKNKNDYLTIARHEVMINLEDIFKIAYNYLKNNGVFYLVHRSNRLDDIMYYAKYYRLNVKMLQFISTKSDGELNTILVKCVKNSKSGVRVLKPICVDNLDTYQHLFEGKC